jgi:hypothetical protein
MESKLFCFFYWRCAFRDTQAVHSKARKAVLEARGFKPIFPIIIFFNYVMQKSHMYMGAIAAGLLFGCQQTPPTSSTSSATANSANQKAIDYLRSQLNLSTNVAIVAESQKPQSANISDLCQTSAPTQDGFEIALVAEDMRYILQTNQDISQIEICRSEDAKPETTKKYIGAGYVLSYPADWKVQDLGLEPSGASTVIFTPSREMSLDNDINNIDLAKLLQKFHQSQQVYTIVSRRLIDNKAIAFDGSENAKDLVITPMDAKVKGAKSGLKKEFTTAIAHSSGGATIWQVKVLVLETDKFSYAIRYHEPKRDANSSKVKLFEQFVSSFALIY